MKVYDISTTRTLKHELQINWSRELTFSKRQYQYICENVPNERGIYCVYLKDYKFSYPAKNGANRWSRLIYVGSGWLDERLAHHLRYARNDVLDDFVDGYNVGYPYAKIYDGHDTIDYPRAAESAFLSLFKAKFGQLPPANRRAEAPQELNCDEFILNQSQNFDVLSRR